MFDFQKCQEFLAQQAKRLANAGYSVESSTFLDPSYPVKTVRYRFEGRNAIGEITIWQEHEWACLILYKCGLSIDEPVISKDGVVLEADGSTQLTPFFDTAIALQTTEAP